MIQQDPGLLGQAELESDAVRRKTSENEGGGKALRERNEPDRVSSRPAPQRKRAENSASKSQKGQRGGGKSRKPLKSTAGGSNRN